MKGILSILGVLVLVVIIVGCAKTINVNYDYDTGTDFSKYHTYDWLPVPEKAKNDNLTIERIKDAVSKELSMKGLSKNTLNPDFLIALHGGREKKVDVTEWGYAYVPRGYYRHGAYWKSPKSDMFLSREISTYEYEIGTLVMDFIDAKTNNLIWRGTGQAIIDPSISPSDREKRIQSGITKILANFPPAE
jgi:hypothetical protein